MHTSYSNSEVRNKGFRVGSHDPDPDTNIVAFRMKAGQTLGWWNNLKNKVVLPAELEKNFLWHAIDCIDMFCVFMWREIFLKQ